MVCDVQSTGMMRGIVREATVQFVHVTRYYVIFAFGERTIYIM